MHRSFFTKLLYLSQLGEELLPNGKKIREEGIMRKTGILVIIVMMTALLCAGAFTKPAVSEDRGLPGPIKTLILAPFTTVGTGLTALGEGFNYVTKSKLETPISQVCRSVNTAKSQLLFHPINVANEFFTGFTGKTVYYDPAKLNWLGERAQKRGPIAQMAEMAGTVIPPVMVATGVTAPFVASMTVPEMFVTTGAISAVGSIGVGEVFDYGEKALIK